MTAQANSAAQASARSQPGPPICATRMPTSAATDVMASERWCQASARTALLPISSPSAATRRNMTSLTTMTTTSTPSPTTEGIRWLGERISCTLSTARKSAAPLSAVETISALMGSALPWP